MTVQQARRPSPRLPAVPSTPRDAAGGEALLRAVTAVLLADRHAAMPELTIRQLAILLSVYLSAERQTVRGLAAQLGIPKMAITRALNRLEETGLACREPDPSDGRSLLVGQTQMGTALLAWLRTQATTAAAQVQALQRPRKSRAAMAGEALLRVLAGVILAGVRADTPELTVRQFVVLLMAYLAAEPLMAGELAVQLRMSKPATTRALDRLEILGLACREPDPADRRCVRVGQTPIGTILLARLKACAATAALRIQAAQRRGTIGAGADPAALVRYFAPAAKAFGVGYTPSAPLTERQLAPYAATLSAAERQELVRLQQENRQLRQERNRLMREMRRFHRER